MTRGRSALAGVDGIICDLDGVLYRGTQAIEGAAEAVAELRRRGLAIVFATNNATQTLTRRAETIRSFGIEVAEDEIVSSAVVTAEHLVAQGLAGASVCLVGMNGIRDALDGSGFAILEGEEAAAADIVVVSGDFTFTYERMRVASNAARAGAYFVATNDDPTFPSEQGLRPGAGAVLASIERASGRRAIVMGKPHPPMLDAAAARLAGCRRIAVIGDQPATDLAGAAARGWETILVLSGVTSRDSADLLEEAPSAVVATIGDVPRLLAS